MSTVDYHTVYILHQRPYTDSKILVELLSQKFGRVSTVFRASKKARNAGTLANFRAMEAKWSGKGQLKTLHSLEASLNSTPCVLSGKALFCGFYLNELLTRALPESDESAFEEASMVFTLYEQTLKKIEKIQEIKEVEPALRRFELFLMATLGFGLDFTVDAHGNAIDESKAYAFSMGEGFSLVSGVNEIRESLFPGYVISALSKGDFSKLETLKFAKFLSRKMLPLAIGDRPLKSRELFQ